MERRGIGKSSHETPMAFTDRAAALEPELAEHLHDLVDLLYRMRFGGHVPEPDELDRAEQSVRSMRLMGGGS